MDKAQEQFENFVRSLPKEVRKERRQELEQLQRSLTSASFTRRSSQASDTSRSSRQLRSSAPQSQTSTSFAPPPRSTQSNAGRSEKSSQVSRTSKDWQAEETGSRRGSGSRGWQAEETGSRRGSGSKQGQQPPQTTARRPSYQASDPGESVSTYSGASTPIAGYIQASVPGRAHFFGSHATADHIGHTAQAEKEKAAPQHWQSKENEVDGGVERYIGHGHRYLGEEPTHLRGGIVTRDSQPGLHGTGYGESQRMGLPIYIGSGLKKFPRRHHISDDLDPEPTCQAERDDLGAWNKRPGRRYINPRNDIATWGTADSCKTLAPPGEDRPAGMSTRHIQLTKIYSDPARRHTHQDPRTWRKREEKAKA